MSLKRTIQSKFTLIELLIVVAIIAILAGMLLPALSGVQKKAKTMRCINNLKQLGLGAIAYRNDYQDRMPPWISTLNPDYIPNMEVYRCSFDRNPSGTAANQWIQHVSTPNAVPTQPGSYNAAYDRPGNTGKYNDNPNANVTRISYFYEFSEAPCDFAVTAPGGGYTYPGDSSLSWNEVKSNCVRSGVHPYTTAKFSSMLSYFPTIRCFWHLEKANQPVMNISYNGNAFKSNVEWETNSWDL